MKFVFQYIGGWQRPSALCCLHLECSTAHVACCSVSYVDGTLTSVTVLICLSLELTSSTCAGLEYLGTSLQLIVCQTGLCSWNIGCLQSIGLWSVSAYLQVDSSVIELITALDSEHTNLTSVTRGSFVRSQSVTLVYWCAWYLWDASFERGSFNTETSERFFQYCQG